MVKLMCLCLSLLMFAATQVTVAAPLNTSGRWITEVSSSKRVKLACINWVAHMEVMVAEGLSKQPLDFLTSSVIALGFNCVRLTWPTYLVTDESLYGVTVRQSFQRNGLSDVIPDLVLKNPSIVDLPLLEAYKAVVSSLVNAKVMIILDNHLSKPGWCCGGSDSNAFFGDSDFDPAVWVAGLTRMASIFRDVPYVVGMSLRNELRGWRQNVDDWYKYMQMGAEAVHAANPNVLVILSGLNFDLDVSFLRDRPVVVSFNNKLVIERHWYGFSDGGAWVDGNPNEVCGRIGGNFKRDYEIVSSYGLPFFVSEFGADQRAVNVNDNRYINFFLGLAAELDLDWAMWSFVSSYYLREGRIGEIEYFGVFDSYWLAIQNTTFMARIFSIQPPFQIRQSVQGDDQEIFHPQTGKCIILNDSNPNQLKLGLCRFTMWNYTQDNIIQIFGSSTCIQATGAGMPATAGTCEKNSGVVAGTTWEMISDSKMHLSSTLGDGTKVCLDVVESDGSYNVVTNTCKCINSDSGCDPASQWFKIIYSNT